MIDSIGSSTSLVSSKRPQGVVQTAALRNTDVLTAIQQGHQKTSGASAPVRVFAVPQTTGTQSNAPKLPRGSLVDVLA